MNPPIEIAAWLGCLAFVVMLLNQGFRLRSNLSAGGAERREVTAGFEPSSRREFEAHQQQNSRIHDLLFERIKQADDVKNSELRQLGERMSGVETQTEHFNQRLYHIEAKLDRLIERKD